MTQKEKCVNLTQEKNTPQNQKKQDANYQVKFSQKRQNKKLVFLQLRAVEKRMLIAEKRAEAIRELVVTVCHEFNNPLAAIKISADLIRRQAPTEEDKNILKGFEENFQKIESEVKRLRDISFERIDFHGPSVTNAARNPSTSPDSKQSPVS